MNTHSILSSHSPLVPLAAIKHNNTQYCVMWNRKNREAVIEAPGKGVVVHQDAKIVESLAEIIGCKSHEISFTNLMISELPYKAHKASRELRHNIYSCHWSDYGSDRMGFDCDLVIRSYLPESYYQGQTS